MNSQEIFNQVLFALRKQGKASFDIKEGCRYRMSDGSKCALGHLIPDEMYSSNFEMKTFPRLMIVYPHKLPKYFQINYNLILDLQQSHDFRMPRESDENPSRSIDLWEEEMICIANRYQLIYTEVGNESATNL